MLNDNQRLKHSITNLIQRVDYHEIYIIDRKAQVSLMIDEAKKALKELGWLPDAVALKLKRVDRGIFCESTRSSIEIMTTVKAANYYGLRGKRCNAVIIDEIVWDRKRFPSSTTDHKLREELGTLCFTHLDKAYLSAIIPTCVSNLIS
jgi:hypothetical protein